MSGEKITDDGERERYPVHGKGRRLSNSDIGEIRRAVDIETHKPNAKV